MSGPLKESNPWAADFDVDIPLEGGASVDIRPPAFVDSADPTIAITQQPANGSVTVGEPGLLSVTLSQEGADEARYTVANAGGAISAPALLRLTGVSQTDPGGGTDPEPSQNLIDNPFNAQSAYHKPLGSNAVLGGPGNPIVDWWTNVYTPVANSGTTFINYRGASGLRDFVSSPSDPLKTVVQGNYSGNSVNEPWDLNFAIRIPEPNDIPAGPPGSISSGDNIVAIYTDEETCVEFYRMWRNTNNNTYYALISYVIDLRGLGHPAVRGERVGMSASGWTIIGGVFDPEELAQGEPQHAYTMAVSGSSGGVFGSSMGLSRQLRWPSANADWFASQSQNNNGPIPYGQAMALPLDLSIGSLGLGSQEMTNFANNLKKYPIYVIDDSYGIVMRGNKGSSISSTLTGDFRKIVPRLRPVLNWNTGGTAEALIGGGSTGDIGSPGPAYTGTLRGPNTAFDA